MYVQSRRFEGAVNANRDIKYFVPLTCDITFKFFNLYLGTAVLKNSTGIHVQNVICNGDQPCHTHFLDLQLLVL